jgi:hypothetical protein
MNRGALAKKTRAMELRVMTIRNKVEDMKVVPIYLKTTEMIADIGTKALDPKTFAPAHTQPRTHTAPHTHTPPHTPSPKPKP